jgi:hypothetical protein
MKRCFLIAAPISLFVLAFALGLVPGREASGIVIDGGASLFWRSMAASYLMIFLALNVAYGCLSLSAIKHASIVRSMLSSVGFFASVYVWVWVIWLFPLC